jgi:hypothetical protein
VASSAPHVPSRPAGLVRRTLRRGWCRWIVVPILVLLLAHAGWTIALGAIFESRVRALAEAGAPVTFSDVAPAPVPDEENAAPVLAEAERWYVENLLADESVTLDYDVAVMHEEAADEALAALRQWLKRGDPYAVMLDRAARRLHLRQDVDWDAGFAMEFVTGGQLQHAITFLEYRVRTAERASAEAMRDLAVGLELAAKVENHFATQLLLRWGIRGYALDTLKELSRKRGFDAQAARAEFDPRFRSDDDAALLKEVLRSERVGGLTVVRRWIDGESPIGMWREAEERGGEAHPEGNRWIYSDAVWGSWWLRGLAYRDGLRFLDLMKEALALADLSPREAFTASQDLVDRYRSSLPSFASHLYAVVPRELMKGRLRHEARMRVARTGLALLELRQARGEWPRDLDAVVPMVGASSILDPYTDEPLEYEAGVRLECIGAIPDWMPPGSEDYEIFRDEYEVVWRFDERAEDGR